MSLEMWDLGQSKLSNKGFLLWEIKRQQKRMLQEVEHLTEQLIGSVILKESGTLFTKCE